MTPPPKHPNPRYDECWCECFTATEGSAEVNRLVAIFGKDLVRECLEDICRKQDEARERLKR